MDIYFSFPLFGIFAHYQDMPSINEITTKMILILKYTQSSKKQQQYTSNINNTTHTQSCMVNNNHTVHGPHTRTVLSQLPDTTYRPSGLTTTDLTVLVCPCRVATHFHDPISHTRTVLS